MFSAVKTVFLPLIFTLFIFLYCDIFLLVKILVINEGASPDLRKHTQMYGLHTLQTHRMQFALQKTKPKPVHHANSPLGYSFGAFPLWRAEMRCAGTSLTVPRGQTPQSSSKRYPVGKQEQKLKSEESLILKEKCQVWLRYWFCILDLIQISWPHSTYVQIARMVVTSMWALWAKSGAWCKVVQHLCHWVIGEDLVLGLCRKH